MKYSTRTLGMVGLCMLSASCATYSGVSKSPDGQLYISGATSYVFFSSPWIRRCDVDGLKLNCEELSESPPKKKHGAAGEAAAMPPPSGPPAATPAPASAAPPPAAPEPAAPVKKHK